VAKVWQVVEAEVFDPGRDHRLVEIVMDPATGRADAAAVPGRAGLIDIGQHKGLFGRQV